jgi:hypothetical protein
MHMYFTVSSTFTLILNITVFYNSEVRRSSFVSVVGFGLGHLTLPEGDLRCERI